MREKDKLALRPPMGWNSWDCYGAAVTEEQLLGNAQYVADNLKQYGYEYIVCDIQWYEPNAKSNDYNNFTELCMDEYSRLIPAENRFPSAKDGNGFKPIADKIHAMGLKFGIHILRGIPRQAVHMNTALKNTTHTAREIAQSFSICSWNTDMYGVDSRKDGAQEYYDSLFEMYASWDVDFVKVDDIAVTEFKPDNLYSAKDEIEMIRRAIDKCGKDMVLSLSPGPALIEEAEHLSEHANMWRMTGDFWDRWDKLYAMFERCEKWQSYVKEGCWPDCDMLPLGRISKNSAYIGEKNRYTNFTVDEQKTMMTLWSIFRSPLILGGELRENRAADLAVITNESILNLDICSSNNRQLYRTVEEAAWACTDKDGNDVVAVFNLADAERDIELDLPQYGFDGKYNAADMWTGDIHTALSGNVVFSIKPHAVKALTLYKV
ncbi:MAG: alpha-galactosidase [Faecalibacterium sp.]|nr:alpha-galactosidase [Ruminococcus sp.]MCM1391297.1 alpha-galactosidase [Ruminococcus sp.]MCM1484729.1 alpha-galactosidase [Faecalibacterium sp.]